MDTSRGLLRVVSSEDLSRIERADYEAQRQAEEEARNRDDVVSGLAGYITPLWDDAKRAKQEPHQRMLESLRQRRGEYEPEKLGEIRKVGGSEIFMMITSVKCRAAGAWLREALTGQGTEKPWTISPTPNPELPEDAENALLMAVGQEVGAMQAEGVEVPPDVVAERIQKAREQMEIKLREVAREKAQDTERVLEDELVEGGFHDAIDDFVDDFVTYPAAILKGPVVHKAPVLKWRRAPATENEDGTAGPRWMPVVEEHLVKRWYRVDPFKFYPAPWASNVEDGYCFEHHRITKQELFGLIGAPGYDEDEIRNVIANSAGLNDWLMLDTLNSADKINQPDTLSRSNAEAPLDALEFYGAVPGNLLMDWGINDPDVNDPERSYNVNVWMIGRHVIKATVNPDPLGKKPYRKASYEEIPSAFWGRSIPDLIRDCQEMANGAARAMANNAAIASGPQVSVNVSRLPAGAKISQMYPWKVWQVESDPLGTTAPAIDFFQPQSNADELMRLFQFFTVLADEYSGLPRYMTGDGNVGSAGRTASGLSALMSNANKLMKAVMASIDRIMVDVLSSLHNFLMQFEYDDYPELEGDIRIVARGAVSVMAREQLALRRGEFLAATANPFDMQIVGLEGRAYLLRELAKGLDLDTDRIVPDLLNLPMIPGEQGGPGGGMEGQPGVGGMPGQPGMPGPDAMQDMQGMPGMPGPQGGRPIGATQDQIPRT